MPAWGESTATEKPRALFFTQSFPPETHAGANRAFCMAEALAARYQLIVVAPRPSHPHPDRFAGADIEAIDENHAYTVMRSREFHPHAVGYVRRGLREIGMAVGLIGRPLPRADLVVASSPSFFLGPLGLMLARSKRAHFAWDLRDLTWVYASEGLTKGGERHRLRMAAARAITKVAEQTLRRADVVIASNRGIKSAVRPVRRNGDTFVAPNGVDRDLHARLEDVASTTPSNERLCVTYAGALGYFQALDSLLISAEEMPHIDFVLAGDGPDRSRLEGMATTRKLTNVTFTGHVDRLALLEIYRQADILFAQLRDLSVMSRATFPSKVFEYLAAGRPIVYAGSGIVADFLTDTDAAVIAAPGDAESIRQSIEKLAGDAELRAEMRSRARAASDAHIREDITEDLVKRLCDSIAPTGEIPPFDPEIDRPAEN